MYLTEEQIDVLRARVQCEIDVEMELIDKATKSVEIAVHIAKAKDLSTLLVRLSAPDVVLDIGSIIIRRKSCKDEPD